MRSLCTFGAIVDPRGAFSRDSLDELRALMP